VVKSGKSAHTDSPPPPPPLLVFQQLVSEKVPSRNSLTTGRKIMERNNLYKNGIPQFDGQTMHSGAEG
jgi:hypothetical protein